MQFISYVRVSTNRQGQSGLGLDAQRVAIANYLRGRGELLAEFQEIESGRKVARPELTRALAECRCTGAVLVIGKIDRLARNVRFFLQTIDESRVDIRFADLPDVCPSTDEGRMLLINMANFAEFEGRRIGTRTRAALQAAKARGTVLGATGPQNLHQNISERKTNADTRALNLADLLATLDGLSQRSAALKLNSMKVPAPNGGKWSHRQVGRELRRLEELA